MWSHPDDGLYWRLFMPVQRPRTRGELCVLEQRASLPTDTAQGGVVALLSTRARPLHSPVPVNTTNTCSNENNTRLQRTNSLWLSAALPVGALSTNLEYLHMLEIQQNLDFHKKNYSGNYFNVCEYVPHYSSIFPKYLWVQLHILGVNSSVFYGCPISYYFSRTFTW